MRNLLGIRRRADHRRSRCCVTACVFVCTVGHGLWAGGAVASEREEASGATRQRSLQIGGLQRSYRLHVPSSVDAERVAPLVLVFHGGGGTPEQIERESRFSELADREAFIVAYPAGYRRSWNDGRGSDAVAAQRDGSDDVGFVAALIDDVGSTFRIDSKRIYATGISNGAMFSHRLGIALSSRIAAIAPVAGGLPQSLLTRFVPQAPVSALIVHGTLDPLVPYRGGEVRVLAGARGSVAGAEESARQWAAHDGCGTTPVAEPATDLADGCTMTRLAYPNCGHATSVVLLRLDGGGHTWPGGSQYLPERWVGRVCRKLDGAALIWQFFRQHAKP